MHIIEYFKQHSIINNCSDIFINDIKNNKFIAYNNNINASDLLNNLLDASNNKKYEYSFIIDINYSNIGIKIKDIKSNVLLYDILYLNYNYNIKLILNSLIVNNIDSYCNFKFLIKCNNTID